MTEQLLVDILSRIAPSESILSIVKIGQTPAVHRSAPSDGVPDPGSFISLQGAVAEHKEGTGARQQPG